MEKVKCIESIEDTTGELVFKKGENYRTYQENNMKIAVISSMFHVFSFNENDENYVWRFFEKVA